MINTETEIDFGTSSLNSLPDISSLKSSSEINIDGNYLGTSPGVEAHVINEINNNNSPLR